MEVSTLNDRISSRVMRRFRDGDPAAVREVYDQYSRPVFTVAYQSLGDRGLAEEAVQQTFLQAWRASSKFDIERDPAPWLYAIARRVAIDLYRREKRHDYEFDVPEVAVLPDSLEGTWEAWQVRTALDRIPEDERDLLRATHFLGLTHSQVAEQMGVPIGTVKSRLYRAHRRMAGLLSHLSEATA